MSLNTEVDFLLPCGFVDEAGELHRAGRMRMARALDEVETVDDGRVRANEAYLPILLLSRVVTRLGSLPAVTPQVIEELFAVDLAYLEDVYLRLNGPGDVIVNTICPHCNGKYQLQVAPLR